MATLKERIEALPRKHALITEYSSRDLGGGMGCGGVSQRSALVVELTDLSAALDVGKGEQPEALKDTGGSAFPKYFGANSDLAPGEYAGMTLRDYFAGQAINALATEALRLNHVSWEATAQHAYTIADALLKERAK